jgi:hypothetical protein
VSAQVSVQGTISEGEGRLSTVGLLVKIAYFVETKKPKKLAADLY